MNISTWNSLKLGKRKNPALLPGHIVLEFEATRKSRIFAHKLGSIDFSKRRDLNSERQNVINAEIGNLTLNGFKYKNIGHVYTEELVTPKASANYSYPIYSHGHPLGSTEFGGMESCARMGLTCASGEGTNSLCNPGKCIIGSIEKVSDKKWRYVSSRTYGSQNRPVIYYLPADRYVDLKTIIRGYYQTYSTDSSPYTVGIDKPASTFSRVYLPPKFYYSEDFLDSAIVTTDERLESVYRKPKVSVIGLEDRKIRFIQNIITLAYPGFSERKLNNRLYATASEEIRDALLSAFSGLEDEWKTRCQSIIEEEYARRYSNIYDGKDLISIVYDRVFDLFESIIQIKSSSLSAPKVSFEKERISRPLYSRLPGISEGYRSDPAFSDVETPALWLSSGVDEFLSKKKDSISSFYYDYLDPENCNPALLDWLAQHAGLTGDLWNPLWDNEIKRAMINNAFGWWDRNTSVSLPGAGNVLTPKGETLERFPFTSSEWSDQTQSNLLDLKLDTKEVITIDSGTIVSEVRFSTKNYSEQSGLVTLDYTNNVKIDKTLWNGLLESKGSLLGAMFLCSLFGLKSHSALELEVVDSQRNILRPKSGLRNAEISAPVLVPYKLDVIQVGSADDAKVGNYANQLVAGVSLSSSVEASKNVFFRVPYYYNRNGKSWDRVMYIARNWMPSNLNVRVQYPYLSASLWAVGDAFFEPEIEEA